MNNDLKIGIGKDWAGWHNKFAQKLDGYITEGYPISFEIINLDSSKWLKIVDSFDFILWNPSYMGVSPASHMKEKIYYLQNILHKNVMPNFNTVWHFESKVAQNYLFTYHGINIPKTVVSFDYEDAVSEIDSFHFPVVMKKSEGAASYNVKLIKNKKTLLNYFEKTFCDQFWGKTRPGTNRFLFLIKNFWHRWFVSWVLWKHANLDGGEGVAYWQEFIPGNDADVRITVIGDRFAYGFWRNNRPNDFRASGSGLIDYQKIVPQELIKYCMSINQKLEFDSMCYDILFTKDSFVITEMSYNYVDKALFASPGYYFRKADDELVFISGHIWPQSLWINWLLIKTKLIALDTILKANNGRDNQ